MWTEGSGECQNHVEACKDVQRSRNRAAEVGFEYFCMDYVSKNGVSVTERNSVTVFPPQGPHLEVQ